MIGQAPHMPADLMDLVWPDHIDREVTLSIPCAQLTLAVPLMLTSTAIPTWGVQVRVGMIACLIAGTVDHRAGLDMCAA